MKKLIYLLFLNINFYTQINNNNNYILNNKDVEIIKSQDYFFQKLKLTEDFIIKKYHPVYHQISFSLDFFLNICLNILGIVIPLGFIKNRDENKKLTTNNKKILDIFLLLIISIIVNIFGIYKLYKLISLYKYTIYTISYIFFYILIIILLIIFDINFIKTNDDKYFFFIFGNLAFFAMVFFLLYFISSLYYFRKIGKNVYHYLHTINSLI